jgi:metal-dependent amidase/aminoacylase/carboxypeptidase family protein
MVTITHARIGEAAFGIAPGAGELWVKLRTREDPPMAAMRADAEAIAQTIATAHGLSLSFETQDDFSATVNDPAAINRLTAALDTLHMPHDDRNLPLRGSEDFGRFGGSGTKMAMMFLGSGESHPQLHNPDYDFPDSLTPIGARLFQRVITDILG